MTSVVINVKLCATNLIYTFVSQKLLIFEGS